ncbi:SRPBCC family protein [Arthrobacter sp. MDT3-44]
MTGLFSHPSAAPDVPGERPDLRTTVSVPTPADHAWAGLTEHLHLWWPAGELSRWGDNSFFDLEDNALVETSAQDDENVWGEVTGGRPGEWLELRWKHAGSASTTVVRLEITGGQDATTLRLTHTGWTTADPQAIYDFYQEFWPEALARYRRFMGGS